MANQNMTHTKGPWRVLPRDDSANIWVFGPENNQCVALIGCDKGEPNDARIATDARLIAAAPDMRLFVQAFLDMNAEVTARGSQARPTFAQLNALLDMARAIAKATGKTS